MPAQPLLRHHEHEHDKEETQGGLKKYPRLWERASCTSNPDATDYEIIVGQAQLPSTTRSSQSE